MRPTLLLCVAACLFIGQVMVIFSFSKYSTQVVQIIPTYDTTTTNKKAAAAAVVSSSLSPEEEEALASPLPAPSSDLFPKRLITVFGLEKSGTTWTHDTICKAFGIQPETPGKEFGLDCVNEDKSVIVQHISQPWGFYPPSKVKDSCSPKNIGRVKDLPAMVPNECFKHKFIGNNVKKQPHKCKEEAGINVDGNGIVDIPPRFNVNITSHINWYVERGVDAIAVVLMRDNNIAHISKTNIICQNATTSHEENEHANEITRHAIEHLPPERIVLVSFEGLVSLKMPYLKDIYRRLGIGDDSTMYIPEFRDANQKYINMDLLQFD